MYHYLHRAYYTGKKYQIRKVQLYNIKKSKWITKSKSKNDTYKEEIYHFLNCVKHRKQTLNPLQQGIDVLKIALAIKKSAKLNKAIKLE